MMLSSSKDDQKGPTTSAASPSVTGWLNISSFFLINLSVSLIASLSLTFGHIQAATSPGNYGQNADQSERGLLCYVCEPKNVADVISEPSVRIQFPKFDDIPDCNGFNNSDAYIKECPPAFSTACYKATVDGNDWRMCGSQELEHPRGKCHKVRDILLCACQKELCNSAFSRTINPLIIITITIIPLAIFFRQ